jgi:hypothetical protein
MSTSQEAQIAVAVAAAQLAAQQAQSAAATARSTVITLNQMATTALFWAGTWDTNRYYAKYSVVLLSDILYASLQDSNKGHSPDSNPDFWQPFGSSGGAPAPDSAITGLDFHQVSSTPTLRETPAEIVTLLNGLNVGRTSDDANSLLKISPREFDVFLGSSDEFFVNTNTNLTGLNVYEEEIDLWSDIITIEATGNLTASSGSNLHLDAALNNMELSADSIFIHGVSPGQVLIGETGDTLNIGTRDSVTLRLGTGVGTVAIGQTSVGDHMMDIGSGILNIGSNDDGGGLPQLKISHREVFVPLGSGDEFFVNTNTNFTGLDIYQEEIDIWSPVIQVGSDLGAGSSSEITLGSSGDLLGFFGATPVVRQTGAAATAGGAYSANEQTMLQTVYNVVRTFGLMA